jgi:hypothetical protein
VACSSEFAADDLLLIVICFFVFFCFSLIPIIFSFCLMHMNVHGSPVGGFVVGIITGLGFLPYTEANKTMRLCKLTSRVLAILFLAFLLIAGSMLFYSNPKSDFCPWCKYLDW